MVHAGNLTCTLTGYLGEVEEDLAYRALVLVFWAIFLDEDLSKLGTPSTSSEGEFSVDHLLETIV
jgi:hypothetical protein